MRTWRRQAGVLAELLDVVRVAQEPGIEHEVGLERNAELVAEADELDRHLVGFHVAQPGEEALAQLPQRQLGGVEDDVGLCPDGIEEAPLLGDRGRDPSPFPQRVSVTRLGEAADEDIVPGLEEEDLRADPATLERAAHGPVGGLRVPGADVEDDRHARVPNPI